MDDQADVQETNPLLLVPQMTLTPDAGSKTKELIDVIDNETISEGAGHGSRAALDTDDKRIRTDKSKDSKESSGHNTRGS